MSPRRDGRTYKGKIELEFWEAEFAIYGLYGLNHHTVEISGDVTKAGRRRRRQTTEDSATQ